jgi:hypothetical protein
MIGLLFSILLGWLLLRWLFPRGSICIAPPAPPTVLHVRLVIQVAQPPAREPGALG